MTAPTLPGLTPDTPPEPAPAAGSRAARLALPMSRHVLKEMAAEYGVCLHPATLRRTDLHTGHAEVIDLPCGSTREDKCPRVRSGRYGCGRPRSGKAGTAPTNLPRPQPRH